MRKDSLTLAFLSLSPANDDDYFFPLLQSLSFAIFFHLHMQSLSFIKCEFLCICLFCSCRGGCLVFHLTEQLRHACNALLRTTSHEKLRNNDMCAAASTFKSQRDELQMQRVFQTFFNLIFSLLKSLKMAWERLRGFSLNATRKGWI